MLYRVLCKLKGNLTAINIYTALFLFLWMKMCLFSIVGAAVPALCVFIRDIRFRLGASILFMVFYLPFWCDDMLLIVFYDFVFAVSLLISERIRKKTSEENASNSLKILLFSMAVILLIDFSLHNVRNGIVYTYINGKYTACMYRIFSIFLISESVKLINVFVKSLKISALIVFNSVFVLSFINYWTTVITNKSFILSDIYLFSTAAGVLSGVQVKTQDIIWFIIYILASIIFNVLLSKQYFNIIDKKERYKKGIRGLAAILVMVILSIGGFLSPLMFNTVASLGFPSHLIVNMTDSSKPSYYDDFIKRMFFDEEVTVSKKGGPNIIVIMSEAFCDLNDVGSFETNTDYMPYIHSLLQQYPSGTLYASVLGNNTCSSEYEFLTGVPTGLTESGAAIYQKYLRENEASIVSLLEKQGYYTVGVHPYKKNGYNRYNAWKSFGFDDIYFDEDFENPVKIRDYISDKSFYEKIIDVYESKRENPLFCFGISMQNHATYLSGYKGDVKLTDKKYSDYEDVNEYLSLLKETDKATESLIDYFSGVDEDTVIVFFGDHQPMIDTSFYSDITGVDYDTMNIAQRKDTYKIPYFIWTNYELNFEAPSEASINYLPNILLNAAGLEEDDWFAFTETAYKHFPVITDNFVKVNGKYIETDTILDDLDVVKPEASGHLYYLLKQYQVSAYNKVHGK